MDKLARFSDYDLFAYVASGLAAFVIWDAARGTVFVLGADWTVASAALTIAFAYVVGHVLAIPSSWLVEKLVVRHILLPPAKILFEAVSLNRFQRALRASMLREYYSPLAAQVKAKLKEKWPDENSGDAMFWHAFPIAKADSISYGRMEAFLRLYGFCRNIAFVGVAGSVFIGVSAGIGWYGSGWSEGILTMLERAAISLLIGLGMLHRHLKFYSLYCNEVFLASAK